MCFPKTSQALTGGPRTTAVKTVILDTSTARRCGYNGPIADMLTIMATTDPSLGVKVSLLSR